MSERALSEAAMLAGLRDIRLPAEAAGGGLAEMLAAIALGLTLGLILAGLARLVSQRRQRQAEPTLAARVAALAGLPEPDRRRAVLALLKRHAPERLRALGPSLFDPVQAPTTDQLVAELNRHV